MRDESIFSHGPSIHVHRSQLMIPLHFFLLVFFFFFFGPFDLRVRGGDGRCVGETGEVIAYVAVVHTICSLQHATHRFLASWEGCGFVSKYKRKAITGIACCSSFHSVLTSLMVVGLGQIL